MPVNEVNVYSNEAGRRLSVALADIVDGLRSWPIWLTLAWQDIRQRYRRSLLGPFWITVTMLVTVIGMGPLYGTLLHIDLKDFFPYLSLGIITWGLISSLILDGCVTYIGNDAIIRSVRLPLSIHVFRMVQRNLLTFAHNAIAFIPVMLFVGLLPRLSWLLSLVGLALIVLAAVPAALILGLLCARFRDMQPIVGSVVQLGFFLTPIMWKPEALGSRAFVAEFNPLYYFLEVVRGPIYGTLPAPSVYIGAAAITVVLYMVGLPFYARFRSRIPFWI